VVAAAEYLVRRRPGRPVVILGASLGAAAALFASAELGGRVRGYILGSPYKGLRTAVWNRLDDALPPLLDWVAYRGLVAVSPPVVPHLDRISPHNAAGGIPADVPVLILAGADDRRARVEEARALLGCLSRRGELVVFPGVDHLRMIDVAPARYRDAVLGLIEKVGSRCDRLSMTGASRFGSRRDQKKQPRRTECSRRDASMFFISFGEYELFCQDGDLPFMHEEYAQRATLVEDFAVADSGGESICFCAARRRGQDWPSLAITQRYSPAVAGFNPGVLVVPETDRLFLGAGRRLLAYDLSAPSRLWEDEADTGFLFWSRYGEIVVMAAELEIAAWDVRGRKLWSRFVEPPWCYRVEGASVILDVMGTVTRLDLSTGSPEV
jgi:hypothetical protein